MTIYDDLRPTVTEIMDEFKQGVVTLIQVTAGSGPIDNPGPSIETSHALTATVKGVSFKFVKDGLAVSSDLEVTSATISTVIPDENDFISIDDTRYKIVKFILIPPTTDTIAWKFIVRKGG